MFRPPIIKVLAIICALQGVFANVIRPFSLILSNETGDDFGRQIRLETEEFLNNIFKSQIGFFKKVKDSLEPNSQRYKDIELFVEKLELAKQEQDLCKKDELYWNSFKETHKSFLLLNDPNDTGLDNDEYQHILEENGIKDLLKNMLTDVAVYFWKMAKTSGKVVATTVDRFIENIQKNKVVF